MTIPKPHSAMSYRELRDYNRAIANLDEFQRAKLRAENRLANVARYKARKDRTI